MVLAWVIAPLILSSMVGGQFVQESMDKCGGLSCVVITECSHMIQLINRVKDGDSSAKRELIKNHCGFMGGLPKVCCRSPGNPSPQTPSSSPGPPTTTPKTQTISRRTTTRRTTTKRTTTRRPTQTTTEPTTTTTTESIETTAITPAFTTTSVLGNRGNVDILNHPECGTAKSLGLRITFGKTAVEGQFPWVVSLVYTNSRGQSVNLCGGTLISSNHVLTAAHCLEGQRGFLLSGVMVGTTDLRVSDGKLMSIAKITPHPRFTNRPVAKFDIAVLQLGEEVEFSNTIRPICVGAPPLLGRSAIDDDLAGVESVVAGWGRTESAFSSDLLQYTTLTTLNNSRCNQIYNRALQEGRLGPLDSFSILSNQICATGEDSTDSCSGDSGGPIFIQTDEERSYLVGVVSFGTNACDSSLPGVYTRISSFKDWISSTVN